MEKAAPDGFVVGKEPSEVVFVYKDQDTPVVEQEVTVKMNGRKLRLQLKNRMQKMVRSYLVQSLASIIKRTL